MRRKAVLAVQQVNPDQNNLPPAKKAKYADHKSLLTQVPKPIFEVTRYAWLRPWPIQSVGPSGHESPCYLQAGQDLTLASPQKPRKILPFRHSLNLQGNRLVPGGAPLPRSIHGVTAVPNRALDYVPLDAALFGA